VIDRQPEERPNHPQPASEDPPTSVQPSEETYRLELRKIPQNRVLVTSEVVQMFKRMNQISSSVHYNERSHKMKFDVREGEKIILHGRLPEIYSLPKIMEGPGLFLSRYCVDLQIDNRTLYVYSDITQEISLGEDYHPIVQTIPLETDKRETNLHYVFLNPLFLKLNKNHFSEFNLSLYNEIGQPLRFHSQTPVTLKLLFKK